MARRLLIVLLLSFLGFSSFAQETDKQTYIVQLTGEPAIRSADRSAGRVRVRTEQGVFRQAARGLRLIEIGSVDTAVNAVIVEGPAGLEAALASLPGVKRVQRDRDLKLFLDAALDTHAVKQAWAELGGVEKAGLGVRVGILDTGIYPDHPAFLRPEGVSIPEGFPKGTARNLELISQSKNKIIVARNYDTQPSAFDYYGHGTAVAAAVAASLTTSPRGVVSGVAPYALIGAYKVSRGTSGSIPTSFVLLAVDDAVNDGMQVMNMSFGSVGYSGASRDVLAEAYSNLVAGGIVMVVAAGNDGPDSMTVDDAASADRVIAVGANNSSKRGNARVISDGIGPLIAGYSTNTDGMEDLSAPLVDVTSLDPSGLACDALPAGSLQGKIPLILRGTCTFATKLMNAQNAGAVGVLLYNNVSTSIFNPDVTLEPSLKIGALLISRADGLDLRDRIAGQTVQVTLGFVRRGDPSVLAGFSSRGPSVELAIKPDLTAVGTQFFTAGTSVALTSEVGVNCQLCDPSGWTSTQGTSFAAPLVAGAAVVLKGARPQLTVDEIRSLLINASDPSVVDGVPQPVMRVGAGRLNLLNALRSNLTASPVSLSFGAGGSTAELSRILRVRNVGTSDAVWRLAVDSRNEVKPTVSAEWMSLPAGETGAVEVSFSQAGLPAGTYQGFITAQLYREDGSEPQVGDTIRIPYWYAVRSTEAATVSIVDVSTNYSSTFSWFEFRVFDASGVPIVDPLPEVTTESTGVSVTSVESVAEAPGTLVAYVRAGPFGGTFQIKIGSYTTSVTLP